MKNHGGFISMDIVFLRKLLVLLFTVSLSSIEHTDLQFAVEEFDALCIPNLQFAAGRI